ncbi:helix-turn-helix domain-containing protein [Polycladomyces sp. WAk]|uniref:Helix-turn-helix domain-containing protein n=1 Tax=Polycladomyces zharkentensis TaxID=2807616 RepID=A0ABS2WIM4_9BACL|nr:helix-turn-helix domain-containing protein [Polycladomyces sp. WAk]
MSKPHNEWKEARERKGLTLEDIQEKTKIQLRYLQAIEDGDFGKLPSMFYAKTYIRAYAACIGVNPTALLRQYEEAMGVDGEVEDSSRQEERVRLSRTQRYAEQKAKAKRKRFEWKPKDWKPKALMTKWHVWVILGVLLLAIPLTILFLQSEDGSNATTGGLPTNSIDSVKRPDTGGSQAVVQLVKPSESNYYGDVYRIEKASEVIVTIKAKKATKFRARGGGPTKPVMSQMVLQEGETKVLKHPHWISLKVWIPKNVVIDVNGYTVDTQGFKTEHTYQFQLAR